MSTDTSGPAFPVDELSQHAGSVCAQHFGVTQRDYFAAHAPPPPDYEFWISQVARTTYGVISDAQCLAKWAYEYADAMLAAREQS